MQKFGKEEIVFSADLRQMWSRITKTKRKIKEDSVSKNLGGTKVTNSKENNWTCHSKDNTQVYN